MDVGNDHEDEEIAFIYNEENPNSSSTSEPHRNASVACATPQPPSIANRRPHWSAYDPYSPGGKPNRSTRGSLLDQDVTPLQESNETQRGILEDFLEMEEDEHSQLGRSGTSNRSMAASLPRDEPIVTSSGLLLTHRKTPVAPHPPLKPNEHIMSPLPRNLHRERFEVEGPGYNKIHGNQIWSIWKRRVSLVWIWLGLSAVIFMVGTAILWHHVSQADQQDAFSKTNSKKFGVSPDEVDEQFANRIVLLPMDMGEADNQQMMYGGPQQNQQMMFPLQPNNRQQQQFMYPQQPNKEYDVPHRRLSEWVEAFEAWAQRHGKTYETDDERKYRLQVWMENHHRTAAKNQKHGDCPLMQRPVFGNANHFQDLTHEEFRSQYLNAQRKPRQLESPHNRGTLGPHLPTRRHADVHHRIVQQASDRHVRPHSQRSYNCKWYDVSCNLRYIIEKYFYGYFGVGRTMEPAYDADSYPNAIDWRELGAVTEVRAQDNCGACWAITAVETLESALFLATGELMTLSETEVILCNEDCQMCAGGWPENAFEYIMENKGIPSQDDLAYDGSYLLKISNVLAGQSDELSNSDISAYKQKVCPAGGGSNDSKDSNSHDSQDQGNDDNGNNNDDYYSPYNFARYGDILAGYGYATEPCVCYTDGSGCTCDSQDENTAVRNVATYGPAVVCVDASDWQDYDGGILTSASGCSQDFLDVNHCVQVVGYAFAEANNGEHGSGDRNSGDERNSGDSNDREGRNLGSGSGDKDVSYEGYWIVRNQWSEYWGMNGYAYVAMGENTCGILNDMLQVYTD